MIKIKRKCSQFYVCMCLLVLLTCFMTALYKRWPHNENGIFVEFLDQVQYDDLSCGCPRTGSSVTDANVPSLCSDWSTARGSNQKVVSYNIFGNITNHNIFTRYYQHLNDRLQEVNKYYPDWIVRLYHNISIQDESGRRFLCELYCKYPNLDLCDVTTLFPSSISEKMKRRIKSDQALLKIQSSFKRQINNSSINQGSKIASATASRFGVIDDTKHVPSYGDFLAGTMWRFIPLADFSVSDFIVRDVDSYILEREVAAVHQWLFSSNALIHVMRDHPLHNGQMLAGMWGASRYRKNGEILPTLLEKMLVWRKRALWNYDQVILRIVMWPEIVDDVLVHDSYHCLNKILAARHRSHPFPTRRDGFLFVGWGPGRSIQELKGITVCPPECRPPEHQDWQLC